MKKLAFIGNGETPAKLLDMFKKLTPGNSGVWGQLQGVDNYKEADYFCVIDYIPVHLKKEIDETKCVFLGAHPRSLKHAYRDMSNYKGVAMFDCDKNFGFGEIWVDVDYDTIISMKPPIKTVTLSCIMSNSSTDVSHVVRRQWLKRFTDKISNLPEIQFNLHGRIIPFTDNMKKYYRGPCGSLDPRGAAATGGKNNHMIGKEEVYKNSKYVLEFDNFSENGHYWSERIFDAFAFWACPIYYNGGGKLHEYIGSNSFQYLDIEKDGTDVLNIIKSSFYDDNLMNIQKARDVLFNKLQIWPRTHFGIFGVCK